MWIEVIGRHTRAREYCSDLQLQAVRSISLFCLAVSHWPSLISSPNQLGFTLWPCQNVSKKLCKFYSPLSKEGFDTKRIQSAANHQNSRFNCKKVKQNILDAVTGEIVCLWHAYNWIASTLLNPAPIVTHGLWASLLYLKWTRTVWCCYFFFPLGNF